MMKTNEVHLFSISFAIIAGVFLSQGIYHMNDFFIGASVGMVLAALSLILFYEPTKLQSKKDYEESDNK